MNKIIQTKLINTLKSEGRYVLNSDNEMSDKIEMMNDIDNILKIIANYDELEPMLKDFFKKKAQKQKWEKTIEK